MKTSGIDHLVVAANSLDDGTDYIAEMLGVAPEGGGVHTSMGTHNRVLRLGEDCYLEVIAINPGAPNPPHPRWFELDSEAMHERLQQKPRLLTWALRTDRIEELAQKSAYPLGAVRPMSRGELGWRLTLTEAGRLPEGGLLPFLIQWDRDPHPASLMPAKDCRLVELAGRHPNPVAVKHLLQSLGAADLLEVQTSESGYETSLVATIETPRGLATLS